MTTDDLNDNDTFTALYAADITCDSCTSSIERSLEPYKQNINNLEFDLTNKLVTVSGSVAPSAIISAIESTGKSAIVRGTGAPNSAAVSILYSGMTSEVRGLARIVSVSDNQALFDITVNGLSKGKYYPSVRECGDLSYGAESTGDAMLKLGELDVNKEDKSGLYKGQSFVKRSIKISDMIGHGFVLSRDELKVDKNESLVGVIARSAGAWENMKQVCDCSGKTIWEERNDAKSKGL